MGKMVFKVRQTNQVRDLIEYLQQFPEEETLRVIVANEVDRKMYCCAEAAVVFTGTKFPMMGFRIVEDGEPLDDDYITDEEDEHETN